MESQEAGFILFKKKKKKRAERREAIRDGRGGGLTVGEGGQN